MSTQSHKAYLPSKASLFSGRGKTCTYLGRAVQQSERRHQFSESLEQFSQESVREGRTELTKGTKQQSSKGMDHAPWEMGLNMQ